MNIRKMTFYRGNFFYILKPRVETIFCFFHYLSTNFPTIVRFTVERLVYPVTKVAKVGSGPDSYLPRYSGVYFWT